MNAPLLNPQESALANSSPPAGQSPGVASAISAAKNALGASGVPNALLGGVLGATPMGALSSLAGGVASAIAAPPPSLTANVSQDPAVKYGAKYQSNMIGSSKAGSAFNVSSGKGSAESKQESAPVPVWIWIVTGLAGVLVLFLGLKK